MGARIDTSDLAALVRGLGRAGTSLEKDLVNNLHTVGPQIAADIKGAAFTKQQRRAVAGVHSSSDSKGVTIQGSGDVLFPGAEYGGRKSRKVTVARGRPLFGQPATIRRRTTMQFLPWLGHEGYMFWPTIREWMPKIEKTTGEIVEKSMGGR
jgi:hypothetical protein